MEVLYRCYRPVARRCLSSGTEAEDAVETALRCLLSRVEQLRTMGEAALAGYICAVAHNAALNILRERGGAGGQHPDRGGGDDQSRRKSYNILEIEVTCSQETGYRIDPKSYMEVEDISTNGRQRQLLYRPSSAFRGDRYGVLRHNTG